MNTRSIMDVEFIKPTKGHNLGSIATRPNFQEAASRGERVDSATFFAVIAEMGKKV